MAFSSTIEGSTVFGNKRVAFGTFDCTAVTGGDIDTGLNICESIMLQLKDTAVGTAPVVVNETLPIDGSAITIVTTSGDAGYWFAIGYGG